MEHTCGSNGSVSTTQAAATQALQGPYVRFTVEEKAQIGRRADEH